MSPIPYFPLLYGGTFRLCKWLGLAPHEVDGEDLTLERILQGAAAELGGQPDSWAAELLGERLGDGARMRRWPFLLLSATMVVVWNLWARPHGPTHPINIHMTAGYVLIAAASTRCHGTVACLTDAARVLCAAAGAAFPPTARRQVLLAVHVASPVVALAAAAASANFIHDFCGILMTQLALLPSAADVAAIFCLCSIAKHGFASINTELSEAAHVGWAGAGAVRAAEARVAALAGRHAAAADLLDGVDHAFRLDLLVLLTDFVLQLVICSFNMTRKLVDPSMDKVLSMFAYDFLIATAALYKFGLLCCVSTDIADELKKMGHNVRRLRLIWLANEGGERLESMLRDFNGAISARPAYISACGFTDLNLELFFKLIGKAVLYAYAALQYHIPMARLALGINSTAII